MSERYHYPGEEPISTDDLIFQIGEKEIDLQRKRKAIASLQEKLINQNKESNHKQDYENQIIKLKEEYEKSISDLTKKLEKEREKVRELREKLDF